MAIQTAIQLDIDILVMTQPNIKKLDKTWAVDELKNAATKTFNKATPMKIGQGPGFIWTQHNSLILYNCYISPNVNTEDYQNFLTILENSILEHKEDKELIITGDFNTTSSMWGNNSTNKRGKIMEEWIAKLNLIVANRGNKPTFERREQRSNIDITLFSENLTNRIKNWAVLTDLESLSDHKFIVFDILPKATINKNRQERETKGQGYIKQIDKVKLVEQLEKRIVGKSLDPTNMYKAIKTASKHSEVETIHRINGAYWYNERVAEARRLCIKARRAYLRAKPEKKGQQHKTYMEFRYKLNTEIP